MKRKHMMLLLLFSFASQGVCQNDYRVSGRIVSAENNEALAFSTISISGTSTGVVSNFLGDFQFSFPQEYAEDSLFVSMLGFHSQKIPIKGLERDATLEIKLEESIIQLEEVAVSSRKLTALEIVNKVIDNIPNNYPVTPYLLHGFTRSHKHECGKYLQLYEADFEVYGTGYHKKTPEKIYVNEARQSMEVPYYHSRVLRANSNPFNSMGHINDVLFKSHSLNTKYNQYVIEKYLIEDGELIYVIQTNNSKYVSHTLYVDAEDYALLKAVMKMTTPAGEDWNPHLNKGISSDSLAFKVTSLIKTIQFEKKEGRYFSKYMDWLIAGELSFQESQEKYCDWGFRFETMFDDIKTTGISKPSKDKLVNFRSQKAPKSTKYSPLFWSNLDVIEDFPISPQIIEDLEINGRLEDQFEQTGEDL